MAERTITLSKSKYLAGLQCHKLLWFELNDPDEGAEPDAALEETFRQGRLVGDEAKKLYPDGIEIPRDYRKPRASFGPTLEKLKLRKPLFEPGFQYGSAYAFLDILEPDGRDAWNIVEVKSTSGVEESHLEDVALQLYICEEAGLRIRKCYLLHINTDYVRKGDIDPKKLFTKEDITAEVRPLVSQVATRLKEMIRFAVSKSAPEVKIGPHCDDPHECAFKEKCWDIVPEQSIFTLYNMRSKKKFELFEGGWLGLKDLPDEVIENDKHRIQVDACRCGEPYADKSAIKSFLKTLKYPLRFLDFESYSGAIPMLDGFRPYQQVPFQFSLHVVEREGVEPKHVSYLAEGRQDPRRDFLNRLKETLGNEGSIVVYNKTFEVGVLRDCCAALSGSKSWLKGIEKRIVDLRDPFRMFHYYHPDQCGSASIKDVLPALTGKNYGHLEIQDGGSASREYMRVTYGDVTDVEKRRVRESLERYCELDTMGMIWVLDTLIAL